MIQELLSIWDITSNFILPIASQRERRGSNMEERPKRKGEANAGVYIGMGIALGAGIGTAIGSAFGAVWGNVAIGVALGVALGAGIGVALGAVFGQARNNRD